MQENHTDTNCTCNHTDTLCAEQIEVHNTSFECSLPKGHTGPHIACTPSFGIHRIAVWEDTLVESLFE